MPTYQYRCKACTNELEAFQKFTDDPLTICPDCGGPLRKLFGNVGIVFKGSGFYATDSRKSNSAADLSKSDTSTSTGDPALAKTEAKSTNSTTESKPAASKPDTTAA